MGVGLWSVSRWGWLVYALFVVSHVGMVKFLRRPLAVYFRQSVSVVALASAAAAALRLCPVYSGAAHFTKF